MMWLTRRGLRKRQEVYRRVFETPAGQEVLSDLATFCRAFTSTFVRGDPYSTALGEGRREVFNRIAGLIALDEDGYARLMAQHLLEPDQAGHRLAEKE